MLMGQFYCFNVDNYFLYCIYVGQQDNNLVCIVSCNFSGCVIIECDWIYFVGGESVFLVFDFDNFCYVLGGSYQGMFEVLDSEIGEG